MNDQLGHRRGNKTRLSRAPADNNAPVHGWKLEEFVKKFEPAAWETFQDVLKDMDQSPKKQRFNCITRVEGFGNLSTRCHAWLLSGRFRVMGFPPGAYEEIEISRPLLEKMRVIDFKESRLIEAGVIDGRKFEDVRIYPIAQSQRSAAGRKPKYDWPGLADVLARAKFRANTVAELVHWCRSNVKTLPGKMSTRDGPDDKTIREAI